MSLILRMLLLAALIGSSALCFAQSTSARSLVGAVRWDAWHGQNGPSTAGIEVERSLGPAKWHYRAPYFAKELGPDAITARSTSQEDMDSEIKMARDAGLDYWAFVYYDPNTALDISINRYIASKKKRGLKFCMIQEHIGDKNLELLITRFKMPEYLTVAGGRPLLYIYSKYVCTQQQLDKLAERCVQEGLKKPYLIMFTHVNEPDAKTGYDFKTDAVSAYTTFPWWPNNPLEQYTKWEQQRWQQLADKGYKVQPWVSTGFDNRPRADNTMTWVAKQDKLTTSFTNDISPDMLGKQVQAALEFNRKNPMASEANAVLIYAWNEFDEGGWICPTLYYGADRLNGISKVLGGKTLPTHTPPSLGTNLTAGAIAVASSFETGSEPGKALDGKLATAWRTKPDSLSGSWIELQLPHPVSINTVLLREGPDQSIRGFELQVPDGSGWKSIAKDSTAGHYAPLYFPTQKLSRIRLLITDLQKPVTLAEMSLIYNPKLKLPKPGLQCEWSLNGDVLDRVGSRHMLPNKEPLYATDAPPAHNGKSLSLTDGFYAYVHDTNGLHPHQIDGMAAFGLSVWVKPSAPKPSNILSKTDAYVMVLDVDGLTRFALGTVDTPISAGRNVAFKLPDEQWSHVVASYDGQALKLFVNGQMVGSHPLTGSVTRAKELAQNLTIGGGYQGLISDMQIWNRAL